MLYVIGENKKLKNVKSEIAGINLTGKLTQHQVDAIDRLLDSVVALHLAENKKTSKDYLHKRLNTILDMDDWREASPNEYQRAVKYVMGCVGFKSGE